MPRRRDPISATSAIAIHGAHYWASVYVAPDRVDAVRSDVERYGRVDLRESERLEVGLDRRDELGPAIVLADPCVRTGTSVVGVVTWCGLGSIEVVLKDAGEPHAYSPESVARVLAEACVEGGTTACLYPAGIHCLKAGPVFVLPAPPTPEATDEPAPEVVAMLDDLERTP